MKIVKKIDSEGLQEKKIETEGSPMKKLTRRFTKKINPEAL